MVSGRSDLVDVTVQLLRETNLAVLVTDSVPDKAVWIPKSQVEVEPADVGGLHLVTLPEWLARDKGLI